jgi:hypothetical protein
MRSRTATRLDPAPAPAQPIRATPPWVRPLILGLTALYLLCRFSGEAGDSDMWWHLTAGKYILQNHRLPVPDPFSFTTNMGTPAYGGELTTRHFNLTHEWGMEVIYYLVQSTAGFGGLVLFRTLLLSVFCGMTGWLAARRSGSFYRGVAAAIIASLIAYQYASDRAYLATFVLVTLTVAVLETRRYLWLLPPVFLIWANCHGGYIMGWAIVGAYSAEALYLHVRGKPLADERKIWIVSVLSVLVTYWNPNAWNTLQVMRHYRDSPLQISIYEWNYPAWWPLDRFGILMLASIAVLVWARKRVRAADWLLFAALGGAAAMALRNVIFIGFIGPIMLATYLPAWKRRVPVFLEYAAGAALLYPIIVAFTSGAAFQLRASQWRYPGGAADFLIAHGVTGHIFNTYEQGGYLMWRLWPKIQVFIDGRALNESVYYDYTHINYNADYQGGKTREQLLEQYGVKAIVMNGFDFGGDIQLLAAALADPSQKEWKLVFRDQKELVYMREPPPGVPVLPSLDALISLEFQCGHNIQNGLNPKCARSLGLMFYRIGDVRRSRKWLTTYLDIDSGDVITRRALQRLTAAGF